jgi:hypothetical protein
MQQFCSKKLESSLLKDCIAEVQDQTRADMYDWAYMYYWGHSVAALNRQSKKQAANLNSCRR